MRKFLCILTVLMCIVAYSDILNAQTVPPYPDKTPYDNAKEHYDAWWRTIRQAEKNVDSAFNAAMGIVNDFKNANASVRATLYSALPASTKTNMVSALSSALSISVNAATNMAKAMTLADAASTAFSNHETKLKTFNDYWDGSGTVTQETTQTEMQAEFNVNGVVGVQADSLMEAFHRLEYAAGIYNLQVQKWNEYAPSQAIAELTISDPSKPGFTQLGCFNHCGDRFDTFSDAGSSHKKKCGTAGNIESVAAPPRRIGILRSRSVSQGCGRDYYHCPKKPNTRHEEQTCSTSGCSVKYRNCLSHTKDHSKHVSSSDEQAQNTQTPSCTPSTPSYHACGIHAIGTSGYHVSYMCNTAPCNNRVYWGCVYAQCPETGSHGTTASSMHACGVHATSVSGDHSLVASCGVSNAWGHICTVTSYYACQTHTHTYPTFSCGRGGCTESVSDPQEHRRTCINGHTYWSCKKIPQDMAEYHKARICTRYKALRQEWDPVNGRNTLVWGVCGESWAYCDRISCRSANGGAIKKHQEGTDTPQ